MSDFRHGFYCYLGNGTMRRFGTKKEAIESAQQFAVEPVPIFKAYWVIDAQPLARTKQTEAMETAERSAKT